MNLFRSEEHVNRWLGGRQAGASLSATHLSELAHEWWGDRLSPQWRPRTRDQSQALLHSVGLTDDFWRLP
jgi:hypothetical protein